MAVRAGVRSRRHGCTIMAVCATLFLLNLYFVSDSRNDSAIGTPECQMSAGRGGADHDANKMEPSLRQVLCTADGKELRCLRDTEDTYFPFSFLRKRFDVSGKEDKGAVFEWTTSYAKTKFPDFSTYNFTREFGHFASYSVETRERVRCISADGGVPMSVQWDSTPYFYPIQIAQFGLQHYSRMISGNSSMSRSVTLGKEHRDWQGSASSLHESSARTYYRDDESGTEYVNISSGPQLTNAGVYVYLKNEPDLHVVSFRWRPQMNASFTFLVKVVETGQLILLNYVQDGDPRCVWPDKVAVGGEQISFSYSLGEHVNMWSVVTRDLLVDAARAMGTLGAGKKADNVIFHPGDLKYVSVGFRGEATIKQEVVQRNEAHREMFLTAADWAVVNQNVKGGWSVPVERSIADRRLVLPAGWHSAMAQGHMISLLSRAYHVTGNVTYMRCAVAGLDLFEKLAGDGGVRNDFLGNLHWYEEYPTTPGSFVLNGFMYSLVGLYDLSSVSAVSPKDANVSFAGDLTEGAARASSLFSTGLRSLLALLPLFDTGSGSIYDLRHVGLGTAPNLARWDYHAVHVYLIKWLHIITGEKLLEDTAKRWASYARGNRAKHN